MALILALMALHVAVQAPSQQMPPRHRALAQSAAAVHTSPAALAHRPAASHSHGTAVQLPATTTELHLAGSGAEVTTEQVPVSGGMAHDSQVPSHAVSQHTPSMQ